MDEALQRLMSIKAIQQGAPTSGERHCICVPQLPGRGPIYRRKGHEIPTSCPMGAKVNTCTSEAGNVALDLVFPKDGRDGAFIINVEYIREGFDSLEMGKAQ